MSRDTVQAIAGAALVALLAVLCLGLEAQP